MRLNLIQKKLVKIDNHTVKSCGTLRIERCKGLPNSDEELYFIICNKGSNGYFVPEMKQIDYFLMIKNYSRYTAVADISLKLRELKIVNGVIEVEMSQIKSSENFLMIDHV